MHLFICSLLFLLFCFQFLHCFSCSFSRIYVFWLWGFGALCLPFFIQQLFFRICTIYIIFVLTPVTLNAVYFALLFLNLLFLLLLDLFDWWSFFFSLSSNLIILFFRLPTSVITLFCAVFSAHFLEECFGKLIGKSQEVLSL